MKQRVVLNFKCRHRETCSNPSRCAKCNNGYRCINCAHRNNCTLENTVRPGARSRCASVVRIGGI